MLIDEVIEYPGKDELIPLEFLNNIDGVINLAGDNIFGFRWTKYKKEKILGSRINTTKLIVESLRHFNLKVPILINASAVGFYGNSNDGNPVYENANKGKGFLAEICEAWEREAMKAQAFAGRIVLARFGVVLGRGSFMERISNSILFRVGTIFGKGNYFFPHIHIDDAVGVVKQALVDERINGPLNVVSAQAITFNCFYRQYCKVKKVIIIIRLPEKLAKIMFGEMAELITKGILVKSKKLEDVDFKFHYKDIKQILEDITS